MSILVITTGGTIGALPHDDPQRPPEVVDMPEGQDLVCRALTEEFCFSEGRCISLEPKDSKMIDPLYRGNIVHLIEKAAEPGVLITHGTDTILQTADFLHQQAAANANLKNKVVVLTGSMVPLANGPESDGYLNLKFSLEKLKALAANNRNDSGVYIVLCDYAKPDDENSKWQPQLYRYEPGQFVKLYSKDGRYSRLRSVK